MAKIVWIVVIFGFIHEGFSAKYEFGDKTNKSCILLDIDASFELRYIDGNITEEAPVFNLNGSKVMFSDSFCGNLFQSRAVLTVKLFPSTELLKFTFISQQMLVDFFLMPAKHFHDINDTDNEEMSGRNYLNVKTTSNTSFLCRSAQQIFFQNQPFYMTMTITNLQFQANLNGIENNEFGPAVECAEDGTTAVPDTTEHEETTVPHTTITEFTSVTTHAKGTTNHTTEITVEPNSTITVEPMTNATEPHTETTNNPHTETTEVISTTPPTTSSPKGSNSDLAIGLGAGFGALIVIIIIAGFLCRYKNKRDGLRRVGKYEEI